MSSRKKKVSKNPSKSKSKSKSKSNSSSAPHTHTHTHTYASVTWSSRVGHRLKSAARTRKQVPHSSKAKSANTSHKAISSRSTNVSRAQRSHKPSQPVPTPSSHGTSSHHTHAHAHNHSHHTHSHTRTQTKNSRHAKSKNRSTHKHTHSTSNTHHHNNNNSKATTESKSKNRVKPAHQQRAHNAWNAKKAVHNKPFVAQSTQKEAARSVSEPQKYEEHPLETSWTLYWDKKLPKNANHNYQNFHRNLNKLGTFNTLEGFWRHYSFLKSPSQLPKDHNIFMFRKDYIPAWETFPDGGCWIIKVLQTNGFVSRLWEELLFATICERFEEPDLMGVALSTRNGHDLVSVWNAHTGLRMSIGERLKELLNLDARTQVEYKPFSSALRDGSTFRNAKPYVFALRNSHSHTHTHTHTHTLTRTKIRSHSRANSSKHPRKKHARGSRQPKHNRSNASNTVNTNTSKHSKQKPHKRH